MLNLDLRVGIAHQKNLLLIKILWGFYFLNLAKFFFDREPSVPSLPPAAVGLALVSLLTVFTLVKRYAALTPYLIILFFYAYFSVLMFFSPYPVNFVFVWLGVLLSVIYQNYLIILIAFACSTGITVYFFPWLVASYSPMISQSDLIYLIMFGVFISAYLILEMKNRKRLETRIEHLAYYDPLTNLPNRTLFQQLSKQMLARAERNQKKLAVLFIDLDNFKSVNDRCGHELGDDLLKTIAGRMKTELRAGDLLCRMGGDEFVSVLEINAEEEASAAAKRINAIVSRPLIHNSQEFSIRSSIGISIYPTDDEDIESLIRNADRAMYRAKAAGGDRWVFYENTDRHY